MNIDLTGQTSLDMKGLTFNYLPNITGHERVNIYLPSRLHLQLVDILVPVYAPYVFEFPLPPQHGPAPFHRPRLVGGGAYLDDVLSLSLWVLWTTDQVNMMAFCLRESAIEEGWREGERKRERKRGGGR